MKLNRIAVSIVVIASTLMSCGHTNKRDTYLQENFSSTNKTEDSTMASSEKLSIVSTAFKEGEMIPKKYTCDGEDVSPPLKWQSVPSNTKSLALIADDPDAPMGTWVHWVIFNIPSTETGLPENVPPKETLPNGSLQGRNDFKNYGYGGPCPPSGTHRYYFKLYAVDTTLKLAAGATKDELLNAMKGHIIAQAQLMGRYSRK
jgi:Raf kinase inhibitor-like YbhB/YbcL family protein